MFAAEMLRVRKQTAEHCFCGVIHASGRSEADVGTCMTLINLLRRFYAVLELTSYCKNKVTVPRTQNPYELRLLNPFRQNVFKEATSF
jgi:hypothetical protein